MDLYKQFQTDPSLEKNGILLEYGKNSKDKLIAIRIARAGGANAQYTKRLEALTRKHRRQIQNDTIERTVLEDLIREAFVDTIILGWENVEDRQGNELIFNRENVLKLFADLPDLFTDIQEQATRAALFRQDIREDDTKN